MNKLCKVLVGSHMYGLNTENSDHDYKGVFVSSLYDCVIQNVPKDINKSTCAKEAKNSKEDIDEQYFSLHHFIRLLAKGEIVCFDLLHARDTVIKTSKTWEYLYDNRQKFYSKRLNGFIGFIIGQTRKYSNRGKRYNCVSDIIKFLEQYPKDMRLEVIWDKLPQNEYANYSKDSKDNIVYSVCERMVHPTVTVEYAINVFNGYKTLYGGRAIEAALKEGYDLKAISHAFRCLDELEQIVHERDITFPTKNRDRILNIKLGKEVVNDDLFLEMEDRVEQIKNDLDKSDLPDTIDINYWNDWLFNEIVYDNYKNVR